MGDEGLFIELSQPPAGQTKSSIKDLVQDRDIIILQYRTVRIQCRTHIFVAGQANVESRWFNKHSHPLCRTCVGHISSRSGQREHRTRTEAKQDLSHVSLNPCNSHTSNPSPDSSAQPFMTTATHQLAEAVLHMVTHCGTSSGVCLCYW